MFYYDVGLNTLNYILYSKEPVCRAGSKIT